MPPEPGPRARGRVAPPPMAASVRLRRRVCPAHPQDQRCHDCRARVPRGERCHAMNVRDHFYRGVYREPYLSRAGNPVLFAVDYAARLVDRVELEARQPEQQAVNALWRTLDAADPEHTRRKPSAA